MRAWPLLLTIVTACHGRRTTIDSPLPVSEVRPDAPRCPDVLLEASLLDVDSGTPARPLANVQLATASTSSTTAADGTVELCIETDKAIEVVAPTDYLDTTVVIGSNATEGIYPIQLRMFTEARVRAFYTERGLVFDDTRGHVLVFQSGDRFAMKLLDSNHGTAQTAAQRYSEEHLPLAWTAGNGGAFVLFPNVDASATTVTIAPAHGPRVTVPVRANKLTLAVTCLVLM